MPESHKCYLRDLGYALKTEAIAARRERDAAPEGSDERSLQEGRLLAYYEVVSAMQNRAEVFEIPLADMCLDDIHPDRDLLSSG